MTSTNFTLSSLLVLVVLLANLGYGVSAFKGSMVSRSTPTMVGTSTALFAAKKAAKKAAAKKAAPAETFKKSEFVASVAEKTGMSKTDSEKALNAVLQTITEVSEHVYGRGGERERSMFCFLDVKFRHVPVRTLGRPSILRLLNCSSHFR